MCYLKAKTIISESHILSWDETSQENVNTFSHGERHGDNTVSCLDSIKTADEIRKVIQHGEIVLHTDNVIFLFDEITDNVSSLESLLDIEI